MSSRERCTRSRLRWAMLPLLLYLEFTSRSFLLLTRFSRSIKSMESHEGEPAKIFLQYDNKMCGSGLRCCRVSSFAKCRNYKLVNLKLNELYIGEHKLDQVSFVTALVLT